MDYFCEIQLRTTCQDNWSELSHALAYKTEIDIPSDITREINALSAVFELADNQFQLIQTKIDDLPESNPIRILNYLEKFFYSKIENIYDYDRELSGHLLKRIDKLYADTSPIHKIQDFLAKNEEKIIEVIDANQDCYFFTQPEIVLILERLENEKYTFVDYWGTLYPIDELEKIANVWGTSID